MSHGVEQEIQVVNEEGLLVYKVKDILEKIPKEYISYKNCGGIYQDVYDSQLEIGTSACRTLEGLQDELLELRGLVAEKAEKSGLYLIATGGNPFLLPNVGELFAEQHHLDAGTNEDKLRLNNFLRIFSPEFFALSVNSPVSQGRVARWKSFRASTKSMDVVNRVNPNIKPTPYLSMEDVERGYLHEFEYEKNYDERRKKSRYYDFSPFTKKDRYTGVYKPTIEVRLFDAQPSIPVTLGYGAILEALAEKSRSFDKNIPNIEITYNRDAAIEKGLQARFMAEQLRDYLPYYNEGVIHAYAIAGVFLEWLEPEIKELGYEKFVEPIKRMIKERRNMADWQLHVYTKKRKDYIPSLIEKTMKNFDKEVFERKIEISLVSEEEEKEDPVIKKGISSIIYALDHVHEVDTRAIANTVITVMEVSPEDKKKLEGHIKKLKNSVLIDGSVNNDTYLTACFAEAMLVSGETLEPEFEKSVKWLLGYAEKNTLWSSQIWLNSYILGVLKRVGVSEEILKNQVEWVKNKSKEEVDLWVLAYMVDTLTLFGVNMEQAVSSIVPQIDKNHWHIEGAEDDTITALIYRLLRSTGYRNPDAVKYLRDQLKKQEKIVNSKSLYNISLILRSLSQEVVK